MIDPDAKDLRQVINDIIEEVINLPKELQILKNSMPKFSSIHWCLDPETRSINNKVLEDIFNKEKKYIKDKDYIKNIFSRSLRSIE